MSWNDGLINDMHTVIVLQLDWASAHLFALTGRAQRDLVRELTARGLLKPTVALREPRMPLHPLSLLAYGHGHFGSVKRHPWDTPDLEDLVQFEGGHAYVRQVFDNWTIERDRLDQQAVVALHDKGEFEDYSDVPGLEFAAGSLPVYKITFANFEALWDVQEWRSSFGGVTCVADIIRARNLGLLMAICCSPLPYRIELGWGHHTHTAALRVSATMVDLKYDDMGQDFASRVFGPGFVLSL